MIVPTNTNTNININPRLRNIHRTTVTYSESVTGQDELFIVLFITATLTSRPKESDEECFRREYPASNSFISRQVLKND